MVSRGNCSCKSILGTSRFSSLFVTGVIKKGTRMRVPFLDTFARPLRSGLSGAGLFFLHLSAATLDCPISTFGHDHLRATIATQIHFTELVCHTTVLLFFVSASGKPGFTFG
jgi:hypothetical protein